MSVLEHSERFMKFIETVDPEDREKQIARIIELDLAEISRISGLTRGMLEALIFDMDVNMINQGNFAQVFEMLDNYAFYEMNTVIQKVCRVNRLDNIVFDGTTPGERNFEEPRFGPYMHLPTSW